MDMSVVIRCRDDSRVFNCVDSIDEDVEVIVATNANATFQKKLATKGIKYCITPRGNLSVISNISFAAAENDHVLITDSDTAFERGCLKKMHDALKDYRVVRAKLKFKHSSSIPLSKVIAEARDYVNSLQVAYTPGVAFKKELIDDLNGYLFNEDVPFAVDADLNFRLKKFGIPVRYLDDAVIYHEAESLIHDINAAFRIGCGCMASAKSQRNHEQFANGSPSINRDLKGVGFRHMPDLIRKKGPSVFAYQLLWDSFFYAGAFKQRISTPHKGASR